VLLNNERTEPVEKNKRLQKWANTNNINALMDDNDIVSSLSELRDFKIK
tara:strand:- start:11 stop:157 length:147 start_codon:yes stop_codon:yes gene_type:complete